MADKKKRLNVTSNQKEQLVLLLEEDPRLIKGKFTANFTHQISQQLWERIAEILNTDKEGPTKTGREWRKVNIYSY